MTETEISYEESGAGSPLVLLHGFPLDHSMWRAQLDGLSNRCRVIAPDLRGFGASPPTGDKVTMAQFADDVASLLDGLAIREPVTMCGLSMGGYIALEFWRRHRARLNALILCDTRAAADAPEVAQNRLVAADRVLQEGQAFLTGSMTPRLLAKNTLEHRPDVVQTLRSMMTAASRAGIAAAARGMAERADFTSDLGQIDCPVLAIVGQEDAVSPPAEMRGMADAIPDASFVDIASAGHMSPMENPTEVNTSILAFLAGLSE